MTKVRMCIIYNLEPVISICTAQKKVKMKSSFTKLTKVMKSPMYRRLELWKQLPDELQTGPSKIKFKNEIKRYKFDVNCT